MKTLAFAEANVIATIGDLSNWFSNTCSSTRCVTIYDLEFSLSWPSETISRTVVMHEGELWLIWVFKKKKTTLSGYRYISGIQHSILDQTSALIGSWLALQRSWQRSRSAWPPTLCVHAQHYTSLPLVPKHRRRNQNKWLLQRLLKRFLIAHHPARWDRHPFCHLLTVPSESSVDFPKKHWIAMLRNSVA